jgi:hypothetical protein
MSTIFEEDWTRDVTTMITLWLLATVVAGALLLTVVRGLFV